MKGITHNSFKPLALTIGLSDSICYLDLSANLLSKCKRLFFLIIYTFFLKLTLPLDDSAVSVLFAETVNGSNPIMPNLKSIKLASNSITTTGFAQLVNSLPQSLESLSLSYNFLGGSDAILIMSKAISKFASLTSINLESCNIGDITDDGMQLAEPEMDNLSSKQLNVFREKGILINLHEYRQVLWNICKYSQQSHGPSCRGNFGGGSYSCSGLAFTELLAHEKPWFAFTFSLHTVA